MTAEDKCAVILAHCAILGFDDHDYARLKHKVEDKAILYTVMSLSDEDAIMELEDAEAAATGDKLLEIGGEELTREESQKLRALPPAWWAPLVKQYAQTDWSDLTQEWFNDVRVNMVAAGITKAREEGRL